MKQRAFALITAGIWISASEFIRNELLFKLYWTEKYQTLGLEFPSAPLNNALWGLWSFLLAALILYLSSRLRLIENIAVSWLFAFVLMWIVTGNLNVLPIPLLLFAVPLSILEVTGAAFLCHRFG
jgi:hypothetical protein